MDDKSNKKGNVSFLINCLNCLVRLTLTYCEGWGVVILGKYSSDA